MPLGSWIPSAHLARGPGPRPFGRGLQATQPAGHARRNCRIIGTLLKDRQIPRPAAAWLRQSKVLRAYWMKPGTAGVVGSALPSASYRNGSVHFCADTLLRLWARTACACARHYARPRMCCLNVVPHHPAIGGIRGNRKWKSKIVARRFMDWRGWHREQLQPSRRDTVRPCNA